MSKVDLRLQCGMPCSKLEVSTAQHGTLSGAGYLHQSPLNDVPGDLVAASASSLDLDITLTNAEFQLDRVAAKWADHKKRDAANVRQEERS